MSTNVYCLIEDGATGPSSRCDNRVGAFTYVLSSEDLESDGSMYSPWAHFAGFKWRLLVFPKGNGSDSYLAVYLDCGGPSTETSSSSGASAYDTYNGENAEWTKLAVFSLHLLHAESPVAQACVRGETPVMDDIFAEMTGDVVKDTSHPFREALRDWGFLEFAPRTYLQPGSHVDADGNATLMVMIKVNGSFKERLLDETEAWDSKRETGFVGLAKRGDVGHLNAILQSLYHIGAIRKAIFQMPVQENCDESDEEEEEEEEEEENGDEKKDDEKRKKRRMNRVARELQDCFCRMQFGRKTVSTTSLLFALRSGERDPESDLELNGNHATQLLLDEFLENFAESAPVETGNLRRLIQGRLRSRLECVDSNYVSEIEEPFYELSVVVRQCETLKDSLERFVAAEVLDGESKVKIDGFEEPQVVSKRLILLDVPPVLQINLERFRYDLGREAPVKIADRHEFDLELDLSGFVENQEVAPVYVLHSVTVHKGDISDGSYHVFVRPFLDVVGFQEELESCWYKFENSVVTPASEEEATRDNFGEVVTETSGGNGRPRAKLTTARTLIYLLKSEVGNLVKDPRPSHLPKFLQQRYAKRK